MRTMLRYAACLGLMLLCGVANAGERRSPLEGQPAIRHRLEMRKGRFEIGPSFAFSINRALRQAITAGAKLQYHLTDWLALGADVGYGIGYDAGLVGKLESQCGGTCFGPASDPDVTDDLKAWGEHKKHFSDIQLAGDVRVTFTPFSGKIGIFSKLFMGYDLYVFGGFGFAMLKTDYSSTSTGAKAEDVNKGFRPGPGFGIGVHLYATNYMSIGLEVKDLVFQDNQSGGDLSRGLAGNEMKADKIYIDADDKKFSNHWFGGINLTFLLPASVAMSR